VNEQNIHEFFTNLLRQRDLKIRELSNELNEFRLNSHGENVEFSQKNNAETAELLAGLRAENERIRTEFRLEKQDLVQKLALQDDEIAKLRDQNAQNMGLVYEKKSSGRVAWPKVFLLMGIFGLLTFFLAKKIYFKPSSTEKLFENYRDDRLFKAEYDINQGQFSKVEEIFDKDLKEKKWEQIRPQIEMMRKIVRAGGRFAQENGGKSSNYVPSDVAEVKEEKPENAPKEKIIEINYDVPVTLRQEATTSSAALMKLKKGTKGKILDKTLTRDKVTTTIDGKKCELKDYWYRIELPENTGWVFGFFTNRSQNSKTVLAEPTAPTPPPPTN
jgi:hypothetical protein